MKDGGNSASSRSTGSTAACSTTTPRCRSSSAEIDAAARSRPPRLVRDRPLDLRHAVRARPRPGQAQPARRPLHRPRQDHEDRRPGDHRPADAEWEDASGRNRGRCSPTQEAAEVGQRANHAPTRRPSSSSPAFLDRLRGRPRARPGLRLRQFPLPRPAGAEGPGAPRQPRGRGAGLTPRLPRVGPEAVRGIEINPYAAELARVSVWIGEISGCRATASSLPQPDPAARSTPSNAATPC